jgi:hypothetical protein
MPIHTFIMDVGKYNAHGPAVENPLHEAEAALIRDPDEGSDAKPQCCRAVLSCVVQGQARVLQVDEEGVEAAVVSQLDHIRVRDEPDAEGLGTHPGQINSGAI